MYIVLLAGLGVIALGGSLDMWAAILSLFGQSANLCTCIYCPYSILKRLNQSNLEKNKEQSYKNRKIALKKILSQKAYFFAFLEHLVHELSVEVQCPYQEFSTVYIDSIFYNIHH